MAPREGPARFTIENLSRRRFLKSSGLVGAGLVLGLKACGGDGSDPSGSSPPEDPGLPPGEPIPPEPPAPPEVEGGEITAFVAIGDDGRMLLTVHRSEMGQGVRTALAMMLAEELRVPWQDVHVLQAIGDPKYGDQNTDGSRSIRQAWTQIRTAGAAAREMLKQAAADQWGVGVADLTVEGGAIRDGDGAALTYGELALAAGALEVPANPPLGPVSSFSIVGRTQEGVDNRDIVSGRAIYGLDVERPGMLHASIERSPTVTGAVRSYDEAAARAVPGVRAIVELSRDPGGLLTNAGVAVVAETTWAALQGRRALEVEWDRGDAGEETPAHREALRAQVQEPQAVVLERGDVAGAQAQADRILEAEYESPYLAHAPMEPLVATVEVDGDRVEIWAPVQDPVRARNAVAGLLGVPPANVTVHVTLLGGGFGRKGQPDFVLEAASVARAVGAPVKVTWTREDEIRHGFYRPENRQMLQASLDAGGEVTSLAGRTVFPTLAKVFLASAVEPVATELDMGWTNLPYDLANVRMEAGGIPSDLRIGWWRAVCNTFHAFAVQSFLDEIAAETGRDPATFQKELLGPDRSLPMGGYDFETARLRACIEAVESMGVYGGALDPGQGVGFAAHMSFRSYVAMAMRVSVDDDNMISIEEVDYAVDCGLVVHPDGVRAQVEGGLVYGLTATLFGEITVRDGAVVEGNFDTYPMLRMDRMPRVNVEILQSDAPPTGMGEPPTSPVAAALTNAVFAATGERIRGLPLRRFGYS